MVEAIQSEKVEGWDCESANMHKRQEESDEEELHETPELDEEDDALLGQAEEDEEELLTEMLGDDPVELTEF